MKSTPLVQILQEIQEISLHRDFSANEVRLLGNFFAPSPSMLNLSACAIANCTSSSEWYALTCDNNLESAIATSRNGSKLLVSITDDHVAVHMETADLQKNLVPLLVWECKPHVEISPWIFEFETSWAAWSPTPRSLAAENRKHEQSWIHSGVQAECGFVARSYCRRTRILEITLYLKHSVRQLKSLDLQLFRSDRSALYPNNKQCQKDLRGCVLERSSFSGLDREETDLITSLMVEDQTPWTITVAFSLPTALEELDHVRMSVVPDRERELIDLADETPIAFQKGRDGIFAACRRKKHMALNEKGEVKTAFGYLLSVGQRNAITENVMRSPSIRGSLQSEKGVDAAYQVFSSLERGTVSPIVGRNEDAIRSYFMAMQRNAGRQQVRLRRQDREATNIEEIEKLNKIESNRQSRSSTIQSNLHVRMGEVMKEVRLSDYLELLDMANKVIDEVLINTMHRELCKRILRGEGTIKKVSEGLQMNESTGRAAFNRALDKIRARVEEASQRL